MIILTVKRRFELSIVSAFILCLLLSFATFSANADKIEKSVLRLHILANSDSTYDQNLKLKVRDEVLKYSENILKNVSGKAQAKNIISEHKNELLSVAENVIKKEGNGESVALELTKCYFERRDYEDFSLPPGYYDAVRIKIGKAKGHNWWCVIFPKVCVGAAADITDNMTDGERDIVKNPDDYKIEFKITELIDSIKSRLFS